MPHLPRLPLRRALTVALAALALASPVLAGPAAAGSVDPTGPDVSSYQHPSGSPIDWRAVAADGQRFAFVKATEGTSYVNGFFAADWSGAATAGLYRGAYHFARPSTTAGSAAAQARAFASAIGPQSLPGTLPPVLDLETAGGLPTVALQAWTRTFLSTLQGVTGRRPMIYTYPSFWASSMGGTAEFAGYPLWIAHYTAATAPTATGWTDWTFWQYTDSATVRGVRGGVDASRFHGDAAGLARLALAAAPAVPEAAPTGLAPGALAVRRTAPGRYTPVSPVRVLDTRTGTGGTSGAVSHQVLVRLPATVPADTAGVALSVSAVSPAGSGWVRASAAGADVGSTALNYVRGAAATGLVVSRSDGSRTVALTVGGAATQLVVDLVGYFDTTSSTGGGWSAAVPARLLDTRPGGAGRTRGPQSGPVTVQLPAGLVGARAAVLAVSVVDAVRDSYVQAGTTARATVLNVAGGRSRTGLVLAAPSPDGTVTLTLHGGPGHLVVDLLGSYGADGTGERYVGSDPVRVVDTRAGLGGPRRSRTVTVTLPADVPAGATALLDVSAVDPTGRGYVRVAGVDGGPSTTALNYSLGEAQTGLVLARTDADRHVTLTVSGATADLVVDLVGHTVAS